MSDATDLELFEGLQALSESAFPKHCSCCGRAYETVEEFVRETAALPWTRGLRTFEDEGGRFFLELYRNCPCGSTLMDVFSDRRDISPRGLKRRQRFGRLLALLEARGVDCEEGRAELLKLMRGERSALLEALGVRTTRAGKRSSEV